MTADQALTRDSLRDVLVGDLVLPPQQRLLLLDRYRPELARDQHQIVIDACEAAVSPDEIALAWRVAKSYQVPLEALRKRVEAAYEALVSEGALDRAAHFGANPDYHVERDDIFNPAIVRERRKAVDQVLQAPAVSLDALDNARIRLAALEFYISHGFDPDRMISSVLLGKHPPESFVALRAKSVVMDSEGNLRLQEQLLLRNASSVWPWSESKEPTTQDVVERTKLELSLIGSNASIELLGCAIVRPAAKEMERRHRVLYVGPDKEEIPLDSHYVRRAASCLSITYPGLPFGERAGRVSDERLTYWIDGDASLEFDRHSHAAAPVRMLEPDRYVSSPMRPDYFPDYMPGQSREGGGTVLEPGHDPLPLARPYAFDLSTPRDFLQREREDARKAREVRKARESFDIREIIAPRETIWMGIESGSLLDIREAKARIAELSTDDAQQLLSELCDRFEKFGNVLLKETTGQTGKPGLDHFGVGVCLLMQGFLTGRDPEHDTRLRGAATKLLVSVCRGLKLKAPEIAPVLRRLAATIDAELIAPEGRAAVKECLEDWFRREISPMGHLPRVLRAPRRTQALFEYLYVAPSETLPPETVRANQRTAWHFVIRSLRRGVLPDFTQQFLTSRATDILKHLESPAGKKDCGQLSEVIHKVVVSSRSLSAEGRYHLIQTYQSAVTVPPFGRMAAVLFRAGLEGGDIEGAVDFASAQGISSTNQVKLAAAAAKELFRRGTVDLAEHVLLEFGLDPRAFDLSDTIASLERERDLEYRNGGNPNLVRVDQLTARIDLLKFCGREGFSVEQRIEQVRVNLAPRGSEKVAVVRVTPLRGNPLHVIWTDTGDHSHITQVLKDAGCEWCVSDTVAKADLMPITIEEGAIRKCLLYGGERMKGPFSLDWAHAAQLLSSHLGTITLRVLLRGYSAEWVSGKELTGFDGLIDRSQLFV